MPKINLKTLFRQVLVFVIFILLWKFVIYIFGFQEFILPSPESILKEYISLAKSGLLLKHTLITLNETLLGFFIGSIIGIFLGYIIAKSKTLEQVLSPYVVAIQTVPVIALAPLIVIWFGFGIESKVVICALIVFFPILVNTIVGVKAIDKNLSRLFKILGAGRFQTLLKLEIPSILPILFAGFKIGITLAVIGAVVGEFVGANAGLGYLTIYASGLMDTPTVFAALIQLALLGITLYAIICLLERLLIPWHVLETKIGKTVTNTNKGRN